MSDLETRLVTLREHLSFPPTPDLVAAVASASAPRRHRGRHAVVALAVMAALLGAVLAASPGARSAFRELFGIGGEQIVRLDEAPPAADRLVPFGRRVTFATASSTAGFHILVPATSADLPPAGAYLAGGPGHRIVSLAWCCDPRLVLSEFRSTIPGLLEKQIGPATTIEHVTVGASRGVWVTGSDHVLRLLDGEQSQSLTVPVHGGVLIWERGPLTVRLEGEVSKARALEIAQSL